MCEKFMERFNWHVKQTILSCFNTISLRRKIRHINTAQMTVIDSVQRRPTFYTEGIFSDDVLLYFVIRPEMVTATYGTLFRIFYVVVACDIIEYLLFDTH